MVYWNWRPEQKVIILSGENSGKTGIYKGYDPLKGKMLIEVLGSSDKILYNPHELKYLGDENNIQTSIDGEEDSEDYIEESDDDFVENENEILSEEDIKRMEIVKSEEAKETFIRLAERKKGVTLDELVAERSIGTKKLPKGPFTRTIRAVFEKGIVKKKSHHRKNQDIYYIESNEDDTRLEEETNSQKTLNSSLREIIEKEPFGNKEEFGEFFIALGRLIKKL